MQSIARRATKREAPKETDKERARRTSLGSATIVASGDNHVAHNIDNETAAEDKGLGNLERGTQTPVLGPRKP